MKIISNRKDFYDYLSDIYGEDPKIVLDRRDYTKSQYQSNNTIVRLFLCDFVIEGFYRDGKYYWGDMASIFSDGDEDYEKLHPNKFYIDKKYIGNGARYRSIQRSPYRSVNKINTKNNCPILISSYKNGEYYKYPNLQNIGINSVFSSQEVYLLLSEWLSPKEDIVDNRTDKEKIISNGFDLKSSFRNIK